MKIDMNNLLAVAMIITSAEAFLANSRAGQGNAALLKSTTVPRAFVPVASRTASSGLFAATLDTEDEVQRLKNMAAKLRAEASALEEEQKMTLAQAASRVFERFDVNSDGKITLDELKAGLERVFKMDLPVQRVQKLLDNFDTSGDGALQVDEFVTVDRFRNRLDALTREERATARKLSVEARADAEAVALYETKKELLNEGPPTTSDKLQSVIPYLFPLLDGLQYARFFAMQHPDNPLITTASQALGLYQSVPFAGLLAFFALTFLSGNPKLNRLVRFNMQQAIYLDVALFVPGLLASVAAAAGQVTGNPALATQFAEYGFDATFVALIAVISYSAVSSVGFGATPNKLPFISKAVEDRMLTLDEIDENGRFIGGRRSEDEETKN